MAKQDIEAILPLSPLQEGLLFHALAERSADPYFMQSAYLLEGELDRAAFERAWNMLARRHPILRTGFVWQRVEKPVQVVRARAAIPISYLDLRDRDRREHEPLLSAWMAEERRAGFDLLKPPLMRLGLLRVADRSFYFVNNHHHLLLDGWSFARLLREALLCYRALIANESPALPPAAPYRNYLSWVARRDEAAAEGYFRAALAGFTMPTPLPMASANSPADDDLPCAEQVLAFSPDESEALAAAARAYRITLNTLIQGAFSLLLQRHSGRREVVFGATVSGRPPDLPGAEAIVGVLINTLPVRVELPPDARLASWLSGLQDRNSELRQYEWTPLSRVRRWSELPAGEPLFESILVFDSYPEQDAGEAPLEVRPLATATRREGGALLTAPRNNYPLSLIVEPARALRLLLCYARNRLSHQAASSLLAQLRCLLRAMAAQPDARLAELPLVEPSERDLLLYRWNAETHGAPASLCVHELFEAAARRAPNALALVCEQSSLSYRELDRRANALARRITQCVAELAPATSSASELRPSPSANSMRSAPELAAESRIGLYLPRSTDLVVAILAVLKAGAAYVPIDPKFPRERVREILADSGARIVLAETRFAAELEGEGYAVFSLDRPSESPGESKQREIRERSPNRHASLAAATEVRPENLAYLIYTSGSTGRPKGVAVEHRQLAHYLRSVLARLPFEGVQSLAFVSTVAADLGHTSLFGALCSGRTLHIITDERIFDPDAMAEVMHRHGIDALKIVPSHLAALLAAANPERVLPRRCLILGGEAASPALLERVRTLAPECAIVNHYGPTETTVGALTHQLEALGPDAAEAVASRKLGVTRAEPMPIGRPLADGQAYVLGTNLEPVPVGMAGELYLGGAGVARGYHARPGQTADRFVPDPFGRRPGARLYRTGDRARFRGDGAIEFLGRSDHQVKVRGNRVELGEIEACLCAQREVREAVVLVEAQGEAQRLVAYVVAREAALDPEALRDRLARQLPEYMVPSAAVVLPALPLTGNGKIDRAALRGRPPSPMRRNQAAAPPENELQASLVQIWAEVLGREVVGIHDDFFALGGDSILSLQIIARANQKGIRITPKQLFAGRTIAAIAAPFSAAAPDAPPPASDERAAPERFALSRLSREQRAALERVHDGELEDLFPASPIQQGMLFHALLSPEANPYFNQIVCRFRQGLDPEAFARAFRVLSGRHEILRTGFVLDEVAEPHQFVRRTVELPLELLDWRELPAQERADALAQLLERDRRRGFHFEQPPLMRATAIRLSEQSWDLVWSLHHALLDGWCQGRMVQEWLTLYAALGRGPLAPPEPAPPYRHYLAWLARQDLAAAETFFRGYLQGFRSPLRLPAPAGAALTPATFAVRERSVTLSSAATNAAQDFVQARGLTLNTLVQAAWALVLARYTARDDVLFGVTVAGRPPELAAAEEIMGSFINSLPLRVRVEPGTALAPWLERLQSDNLELRQYEFSPLGEVQRWSELEPGSSLFDTLLVYQNLPVDEAVLDAQRHELGIELTVQEAWTHYPLTIYAVPGRELSFQFAYDLHRIDGDLVTRLADELIALIPRMVARPDAALVELATASQTEGPRLILRGEERPFYPDTVMAMIAAQARRTPGDVAVSAGERQLRYGELNARSNQLARRLRRSGIGRGSLVGLCTTRSLEMMVGLLGVLKAGAAYVPLDPTYPRERLRNMLEGTPLALLLTEAGLAQELPPHAAQVFYLDRDWPSAASESADELPAIARAEELAYVIYTSGSTGRPKGVMVRHGAVANFLHSMIEQLAFDRELVLLATTSLSFDIAVLELFLPLALGGRVVLASRNDASDGERLSALLTSSRANCLQATPTGWRAMLESGSPRLERVTVLCGGEALSPELLSSIRQAGGVPWNLYGPTETTVWSSLHRMRPEQESAPLGRPIANTSIYLLDRHLRLTPAGVAGEVYIGGAGLARGYLGQPALTAERFVPDPFSAKPGSRMYRTGDLGRQDADGSLQFLGRSDHQLKLRGFRIELGEIESQLRAHPQVAEAVVSARDEAGVPSLVAYVIPKAQANPSPEELRLFLKQRLPDYMVPARYLALDRLPTTPNGKLDRRALPAPVVARAARPHLQSATEEIVSAIWAEVLGRENLGAHENFFELGGHSLLATRVISRVRSAFQLALPLRALFDHPTVSRLARAVDDARRAGEGAPLPSPLRRQPRGQKLPLSFAQQRLWFLDQLQGERALFTIPFALRLAGVLDPELLRQSMERVIGRHEVLRTAFVAEAGVPWQQISPLARFELPLQDLSGRDAEPVEAELLAELDAFFALRFDLRRPPLLRARLLRLSAEQHVLALALHHIVADGWSLALLVDDLMTAYSAPRRGQEASALSEPALQYADYAVWQREELPGRLWEMQLSYWRSELAGGEAALVLPGARASRSSEPCGARLVRELPTALVTALGRSADQHGVSLFMVLYAGLNVVLYQQTGRGDLLLGTDVANRHVAETESMVGFFVNQLVLRCRIEDGLALAALLERCKRVALDAYQHQDLPFDALVADQVFERDPQRTPLFQIKLVLQNTPAANLTLEDLAITEIELPVRDVELDLQINASVHEAGLQLSYDYRADVYSAEVIEQLNALYAFALEALGTGEVQTVRALRELLDRREQELTERAHDAGRAIREQRRASLGTVTRRPVAMKGT